MSVNLQEPGYLWACRSDFISIGFQPGEKAATIVRVVCTLITVSIVSSWCRKKIIGRYLLFFSHWFSGLLHQLAQLVLAQMVFLCWTTSSDLKFVKAMKFVELVSGNMLAVTNVAICVNLALVVSSHHTMSTVKAVTSPQIILAFLLVSVIATAAVVPFWESMTVSGTLLWSINTNQDKHNWVLASIFFMELIAGVAMAIIGALLVIFRWPELRQVWRLHRRIKFYIFLSVIATVVDLAIGIGGLVYVLDARYKARLIMVTWTMRHVHIALDTLVLYSALSINNKVAVEVGRNFRPSGRGTLPKPTDTTAFAHRRGLGLRAPSSIAPEAV